MPTTWLDELEQGVEQEVGTKPKTSSVPKFGSKSKSDDEKWGLPLFLLAVVLTIGLVGAYIAKRNSTLTHSAAQENWAEQTSNYQPTTPSIQEKIWERTKWNTDIITLISIVDNHNLSVTQNGYPKSHYIYLNEDWTIDRLPDHVNLGSQDKMFLERFVRKLN